MKIFIATTSLLPNYGGPAISVSRLALALTEAGADVAIWAADQSAVKTPFLTPSPRLTCLRGALTDAISGSGRPDVFHDNGLWRPHNHRLARLAGTRKIPRLVSTRGMLEPWAIAHKGWKKKIAWWTYQRRDLVLAGRLHATSDTEAKNLRLLGLRVPIQVIPNGVDAVEMTAGENPRRPGPKIALFLGRIYPVKGLPLLIEAWARIRPGGWVLRIAGPDEAGHRLEIEALVASHGLQNDVAFLGPVSGAEKTSILNGADLFVLPTHSESFGMAIAEALAHGVPVLTTTGAPWPQLTEGGFGWRVEPTVDGVAAGLREATASDGESLRTMGAKGQKWVNMHLQWREIAGRFLATYGALAKGRNLTGV